MTRRPPVAEHPLQRQIADALRLEIAPPGKVSRHGVVWWTWTTPAMQAHDDSIDYVTSDGLVAAWL